MKVRFTKSPTGEYDLAYFIGDEADLETELATELVEKKVAELIPDQEIDRTPPPPEMIEDRRDKTKAEKR